MDMSGEHRIAAPREIVWTALNDPEILKACIPGCQKLEGSLDDGLSARVTTKIGPVKATFDGTVSFSEVDAPKSYVISGEGKGGVAGFAKGGARVVLTDLGEETMLAYTVNAQVGGKLAQLGGRLIDSTAKQMAEQFFACFCEKAARSPGEVVMPSQVRMAADEMGRGRDESAAPPALETLPAAPGVPIPPDTSTAPNVRGWLIAIAVVVVLAILYGVFA